MVADTHTVVDPRAVVVEAFHALIAHCAVSRSRRADDLAVRT